VLKNKAVKKESVLHFLKKWYVGMIAQALGGKFSNEYFLTLLSTNQGIGKTTFLREYVLPQELLTYRKEHPLSTDDDFKVIMSQSILIVDDEMDGRSYEMEKTFKSILSTSELTMRRKYDRRISTIKRRCSFAGSGNHLQIVREAQNRRVIPLEVEKFHYDRLNGLDLTDLFMEAYHLYVGGFQYSYQKSDQQILKELDDDYVLKSDVDMVLDECVLLPKFEGDSVPISNLDLVSSLLRKYPYFAKRINVPTIGKLMAERGFDSQKRGQNKATYYIISATSKVLILRDEYNEKMELL
jgi:predicted P-loop ATPase